MIVSESRQKYANEFAKIVGKTLEFWPAIFTRPCPVENATTRLNERGLLLAHRATWERLVASGSEVGVIFEDEAYPSSPESITRMDRELEAMNTDILYLGWCHHELKYVPPLCSHAYAITRHAALKLIRNFDQCDAAVDHLLARQNMTWKLAECPPNAAKTWTYGLFIQRDTDTGSMQ